MHWLCRNPSQPWGAREQSEIIDAGFMEVGRVRDDEDHGQFEIQLDIRRRIKCIWSCAPFRNRLHGIQGTMDPCKIHSQTLPKETGRTRAIDVEWTIGSVAFLRGMDDKKRRSRKELEAKIF